MAGFPLKTIQEYPEVHHIANFALSSAAIPPNDLVLLVPDSAIVIDRVTIYCDVDDVQATFVVKKANKGQALTAGTGHQAISNTITDTTAADNTLVFTIDTDHNVVNPDQLFGIVYTDLDTPSVSHMCITVYYRSFAHGKPL